MGTKTATVSVELLKKYDRSGPRYTSYPTVPNWVNTIGPDDYRHSLRRAARRVDEPLAMYCHIPFCRRRCYYCGCNTVITNNPERVDSYVSNLLTEMTNVAELLDQRKRISQLHFGGGTPTYLDCQGIELLVKNVQSHFEFIEKAELSIEIDPRVTTTEQLEFLAASGFNRISMGVQDFDPEVQKASGRVQPVELIKDLTSHSRRLRFKGINFDLIYGLPKQSVESFTRTIETTIALRPDRVAVYSFAYLPSIMPHQSKISPDDLPPTEVKYQLFATAVERFIAAGYRQIGMDHFALPDDELSRAQNDGRLFRNFMGYTVQQAPEMIGLGMSAIGYVDNSFYQNYSKLDSYQNSITERRLAVYRGMHLSKDDLIRQYVITRLMCNFRLNFKAFADQFGIEYDEYFAGVRDNLRSFFEDDLIREDEGGLAITPVGRTFVRNIAMAYDAYLDSDPSGKASTFSRTI